ncbi:unnamed protein product [Nezara viridula]|uniref:Uncharacterized protein n=1 Tax=Nezara viridula TaxID=85310 RepID=A0A9P0EBX7_NEZVI|nr:unnamed protein product [Nezara viridula]
MSRLIKSDLRMGAFLRMTGQRLTTSLKKLEWIDAKCTLAATSMQDSPLQLIRPGQLSSGGKEHSKVHLCLGLALRKPWSQSTRLSALVRTGEDGMPQSTPQFGKPQAISGPSS